MKWAILALMAAIILAPAVSAAGQETSPNYLIKADELMKGMMENNFYLMPMSDLVNATANPSELAKWVIVDVRPETSYAAGHVPGSVNVPFTKGVGIMDAIPTDKKIAVVCQLDTNSAFAVALLRIFGDRDAWVVQGGIPAWEDAGKQLEK
jgi:rhodanese-related sulfurtransferase